MAIALGVLLLAFSFTTERTAHVALRLPGVVVVAIGALIAWMPASRRLVADTGAALREDRAHTAALVAIVGIATFARASLLDMDSRYDEAYSFLNWVTVPIRSATEAFPSANNHVLNTVMAHGTWRVLGDGMLAMRLPAFLAGVATIPAVYAAGRLLHGRQVGLLAAALAAGAGPLIEYATNGRGYALCWLCFAVLIALTARIAHQPDPAALVLWALVAALGLYAIPLTALFLVPLGGWLAVTFLYERTSARLLEVVGLAIASGAGGLLLYADVLHDEGWKYEGPGIDDPVAFAWRVWEFLHVRTGGVLAIVAIPLVLAGLVLHRRTGRHRIPLGMIVVLSVPVLAVALPHPPPYERTWAYLVVVDLLLLAAGIVHLARGIPSRRLGVPVAATLLAAGLALVVAVGRPPYSLDDAPVLGARQATTWLRDEHPGAPLIVSIFTQPSMALHFRFERVPSGLVQTGGPITAAGRPPAFLGVSRTREESPEQVFALAGFAAPYPELRLERTFDELDVYAFVNPG